MSMSGTRKFLVGAAEEMTPKKGGKWLQQAEEGRSINNLWTGKELGRNGKIATGGVLAGYIGFQATGAQTAAAQQQVDAQSYSSNIESLPGTRGDGVGYTAYPNFNIKDFAPQGDLVFALHNLRHGG